MASTKALLHYTSLLYGYFLIIFILNLHWQKFIYKFKPKKTKSASVEVSGFRLYSMVILSKSMFFHWVLEVFFV